jgi:hypothetical protein
VFIHLPEQHMTGGLRLFPSNMQPHSFSKRQLAATALMFDEGEKNSALRDNKSVCGFTSSKIRTTWLQIANDFWDL